MIYSLQWANQSSKLSMRLQQRKLVKESRTLKKGAAGFYPLLGQSIAMISPLGAVADDAVTR